MLDNFYKSLQQTMLFWFLWFYWSGRLSSGQLDLQTTPDHTKSQNKNKLYKPYVFDYFRNKQQTRKVVLVFLVFLVWPTLQRPAGSADHSRPEKQSKQQQQQQQQRYKLYVLVHFSKAAKTRCFGFAVFFDLADSPAASWIYRPLQSRKT